MDKPFESFREVLNTAQSGEKLLFHPYSSPLFIESIEKKERKRYQKEGRPRKSTQIYTKEIVEVDKIKFQDIKERWRKIPKIKSKHTTVEYLTGLYSELLEIHSLSDMNNVNWWDLKYIIAQCIRDIEKRS